MPQTKSHGKTAERKRAEIRELELQMTKKFLCGTCHLGFDDQQEYEKHNDCEEHNYHITRKIGTLVPGLAFCAACSCLVQTQYGWESHVLTDKHQRVKQSLKLCGIEGEFDEPLGCTSPGQIGLPISPTEIDMKRATTYGYGHGGKMGAGIPIIGLDSIYSLMKGQPTKHVNLMEKFTCRVCMETFTFELRGNHLGSNEHWMNYLRKNYPGWFNKVMEIPPEFVIQIKFKLMFYASKIEQREKASESTTAQALRERFSIQATQRKSHNIGKDRNERGHYSRPKYGEVVFVKEGEKDIPKYVTRTPNPDVKKNKYGKSWQKKKEKEYLNFVQSTDSWNQGKDGGESSGPNESFTQGYQVQTSESNATTSDKTQSEEQKDSESEKKTEDPIVTVEKPKTDTDVNKRQRVSLMHSSSDKKRGGPVGGSRGGSRGGFRGGSQSVPRGTGPRGGSWSRGGAMDGPRGSSKLPFRGHHSSRGCPVGGPIRSLAEDQWETGHQDGYQAEDYYGEEFYDPHIEQEGGYGYEEYGPHNTEEYYGYGYGQEDFDPYYREDGGYGHEEGYEYGYEYGYEQIHPSKRQRPNEFQEGYYEEPAMPDQYGYGGRGRGRGVGGPTPRGRGRGSGPPPFRGSGPPPFRGSGPPPGRGSGHLQSRGQQSHWGAAPRGRGTRRPY